MSADDLSLHIDALSNRYGSEAVIPCGSDREKFRCVMVQFRGLMRLYLNFSVRFPVEAPRLYLPGARGTLVPLPTTLTPPWSGAELVPLWLDECILRIGKLLEPHVNVADFRVPSLDPTTVELIQGDPTYAESVFSETELSAAIATSLVSSLDEVERFAKDNETMRPAIHALSQRVTELQQHVAQRCTRCTDLASQLETMYGLPNVLGRYRQRLAELDAASAACGDAMLRAAPEDEETAADDYVAKRSAFHAAELRLRAFKAKGDGSSPPPAL